LLPIRCSTSCHSVESPTARCFCLGETLL
jgi:hypothetical protein